MLREISRVECSKKLLSLRISRIIKMKIEITSDEKLVANTEQILYHPIIGNMDSESSANVMKSVIVIRYRNVSSLGSLL